MDAQAVNTLGGICELVGLGLVVRDLVQVVGYRGHLRRLQRRQQQMRRAIVARARRFLSRPTGDDLPFQVAASVSRSVKARMVGEQDQAPAIKVRPGQTLEQGMAMLRLQVEQLRHELWLERRDRQHAIEEESERTREHLERTADRLHTALESVRADLRRLERLTTGVVRLRRDGIVLLAFGILLTTWPAWWAEHVLWWLTWTLTGTLAVAYVAWRLCRSILVAIRNG
jgi:hypothetical protein